MKDKDLLLRLIDENYEELRSSDIYVEYISYLKLISKLKKMVFDFSVIESIDSNDVEILNKVMNNSDVLILRLKELYSGKYRENLSSDDIQNIVNKISLDINEKILSSDRFIKLHNMISYYPSIRKIIEEDDINDNYMHVIDFIVEDCYKRGKISSEEAVKLNLLVANYCTSVPELENDTEEFVLEENTESIYDKLVELFQRYGYDFESLQKDTKDKFCKYVKLEYAEYVFSVFSKYGVTADDINKCQKTIYKILINNERESFDDICKFIDDNNCSFSVILNDFSGAFCKKNRRYRIKNDDANSKKDKKSGEGYDYISLVGSYDDFIKNVELLKEIKNIDKIGDSHFSRFKVFLNTEHETILNNLAILRQYGIIDENEYPSAIVALTGNFTSYQLDRFIETGNYNYIKNNPNYLKTPKNPLKFYKIRRACDLGEVITRGRGNKKEIMDDDIHYKGIYLKKRDDDGQKLETPKIVQRRFIDDDLSSREELLVDNIPEDRRRPVRYYLKNRNLYGDSFKKQLYNENYFYQVFESDKLFKNNLVEEAVQDIFKLEKDYDVGYEDNIINDDFVKFLDNYKSWISSLGSSVKLKEDNNTYEFRAYNHPEHIITISRQKVLRLCSLFKDNNLWVDNVDWSFDEKVSLVLSIIVKDSIINYWELLELKKVVTSIVSEYLHIEENKIRGAK